MVGHLLSRQGPRLPPHLRSAAGVHPLTPELTSEGWRGLRALAAMKLLMAAVMNLMIDGGDDRLALTLYSRAVSHGHWGPRAPLPLCHRLHSLYSPRRGSARACLL